MHLLFINNREVKEPFKEITYMLLPEPGEKNEIVNKFMFDHPEFKEWEVEYIPAQVKLTKKTSITITLPNEP
jgi:hypothetical protein